MSDTLNIDLITIFPHMLDGFLNESILKRAIQSGHISLRRTQLRDFTEDAHRSVDDRPYGGGPGMVMMPEPIFKAVESVRTEGARVIMMTPQGKPFARALLPSCQPRRKHAARGARCSQNCHPTALRRLGATTAGNQPTTLTLSPTLTLTLFAVLHIRPPCWLGLWL